MFRKPNAQSIPLHSNAKSERQAERECQKNQLPLIYNYFSTEKQKNAYVTITPEGIFQNQLGEKLNGSYLYVVSEQGELIHALDDGIFFHSALANGKKVFGAGKLEIDNGVLKMVSNESGHYKPIDKQMEMFLKILFSLSNNPKLIYESHCKAENGIAEQYYLAEFSTGTYRVFNTREVNKNKNQEKLIDADHYETQCDTTRSRFNRKPKTKHALTTNNSIFHKSSSVNHNNTSNDKEKNSPVNDDIVDEKDLSKEEVVRSNRCNPFTLIKDYFQGKADDQKEVTTNHSKRL